MKINEIEKEDVKNIINIDVDQCKTMCEGINQRILKEGERIQVFLRTGFLLQFSTIIYGICAKIYSTIDKIIQKLLILDRLKKERMKKKKS